MNFLTERCWYFLQNTLLKYIIVNYSLYMFFMHNKNLKTSVLRKASRVSNKSSASTVFKKNVYLLTALGL